MPCAPLPVTSALDKGRALYRLFDERAQLTLLCDLIQGNDGNLDRSDAFIDALEPVAAAFGDSWADLENAADDAALDPTAEDTSSYFAPEAPSAAVFGGVR